MNELAILAAELGKLGAIIAKHDDVMANLRRGGDWDLYVPSIAAAEQILTHRLGQPARVVHRSYVSSYFYWWGSIDLLANWTWKSVVLLDYEHLAQLSELDATGLHRVRQPYQAAQLILTKLLWHGYIEDRHFGDLTDQARNDPGGVIDHLAEFVGGSLAHQIVNHVRQGDLGRVSSLAGTTQRAIVRRMITRDPCGFGRGLLSHLVGEVRCRLHPTGPLFIVGPDVDVELLTKRTLRLAPVIPAVIFESRPTEPGFGEDLKWAISYWWALAAERSRGTAVLVSGSAQVRRMAGLIHTPKPMPLREAADIATFGIRADGVADGCR